MQWFKNTIALIRRLGSADETTLTSPEKTSHLECKVTRIMDATTQKVWMMWTTPEHFSQWFGIPPMSATRDTTSMDLRVGGAWRADMVNEKDGTRMPYGGRYLEIESQKRLVYSIVDPAHPDSMDQEIVTVTLKDIAGKTEMTLHQKGHLPAAEYDGPLQRGYGTFFDRMATHLMLTQ